MAMERYIGVLHPFQYQTQVTKKRISTYVCGHGIAYTSVIAYSFHNPVVLAVYIRGWICVFSFLLDSFTQEYILRYES